MSNAYTITLVNESLHTQNFYFFQKPAKYTGGAAVYSNSIYQNQLRGTGSGSILTFEMKLDFIAGVQDQAKSLKVGQASGFISAARNVSLTPMTGKSDNNAVEMLINPLGLEKPISDGEVQPGAFRIITPSFSPANKKYNAGLSVRQPDGSIVLSNFVDAQPSKNIDVQPIIKFYVQTGGYEAGQVVNFTSSSVAAALCDATDGQQSFNVTYTVDGLWNVQ